MAAVKTRDARVADFEDSEIRDTVIQYNLDPEDGEVLAGKDYVGSSWKSSHAQVFWIGSQADVNFPQESIIESRHSVQSYLTDHELEIGDHAARFYGIDQQDLLSRKEVKEVVDDLNDSEIPSEYSELETWLNDELKFEEEDGLVKIPIIADLEIHPHKIPDKKELGRFPEVDYIEQDGMHNPADGMTERNLYRGPWMQTSYENVAGRLLTEVEPGDTYQLPSVYFDSSFLNSEDEGFPVLEINAGSHPVPHWDRIEHVYMQLFEENPEAI